MAESKPHRTVTQMLALGRRQFTHARAVLLHDQSARRLLFDDFLGNFHCAFMAPPQSSVKEKPPTASGEKPKEIRIKIKIEITIQTRRQEGKISSRRFLFARERRM